MIKIVSSAEWNRLKDLEEHFHEKLSVAVNEARMDIMETQGKIWESMCRHEAQQCDGYEKGIEKLELKTLEQRNTITTLYEDIDKLQKIRKVGGRKNG